MSADVMAAHVSRRRFLQTAAAVTAAGPTILSTLPKSRAAANERLTIGMIGVGTMGRGHVGRFLGYGDVQIIAVSDVVAERRQHSRKNIEDHYAKQSGQGTYRGCSVHNDFRELLALDGLDAVVIATPDHWHVPGSILAARAKKDIYCEKPLTLTIGEGRHLVNEVRANNIVFQTGSQQRSEFGQVFEQAVNLIRSGKIGRVKTVRVGVGASPVPCDLPEEQVPEGTDWDLWLGQAPWRGYNEILCPKGVHQHFPAFRNYREYAGGGLADMGAHHFDIAQWALDMDGSGPVKVEPPAEGDSGLKFTYAGGVEMIHGGPSGCTFEGELGTIYVDRGKLESTPDSIVKTPLEENAPRVEHATDHGRNWLDAIKSRQKPICDVEVGHRSASVCHLANLGYRLRRTLTWDPATERFANDDEANALLNREARSPWNV